MLLPFTTNQVAGVAPISVKSPAISNQGLTDPSHSRPIQVGQAAVVEARKHLPGVAGSSFGPVCNLSEREPAF